MPKHLFNPVISYSTLRDWLSRTVKATGVLLAASRDSSTVRIFRSTLIIGVVTLFVKLTAMIKELVVAQQFGRSDSLDAFLIAFLIPTVFVSQVIVALQAALIPTFVCLYGKRRDAAQRLLSSVLLLTSAGMLVAAAMLGLVAPYYLPYLGSGFPPGKLLLTRDLVYGLLPYIFFAGVGACTSAVLNAGEKFMLPAAVPLITPLLTMVFARFCATSWGAFSLVWAALLGGVLELLILVAALKKMGLHFSLRWGGLDDNLRSVFAQFAPLLAASFFSSGITLVDQSMTAMLAPGSVAALSYAGKVVNTVLAITAAALGTALLPHFSKMVAGQDWTGCRRALRKYAILIVVTTVPLTVLLMAFSRSLVRGLFQHGAFQADDTEVVSRVLLCFATQIPFYTLTILLVRFLVSVGRNGFLLLVTAMNLGLDIIFNLVFIRLWGVAGIALATSVFFAVSVLILSADARRFLRRRETFRGVALA